MSTSCKDFTIGDLGHPIYLNVSVCGGNALSSPIVSGTIYFEAPDGTSFEREAELVSDAVVRWVTAEDDYDAPGFTVPGAWEAFARVVTEDGRVRETSCGTFVVKASRRS